MTDRRREKGWMALGIDLVTLRMFLSTAEEGSVGRASERENIALSAISRRIGDLEARTGLTLFDRRDRGMALTAAGRAMADHARSIFDQLDGVAREIQSIRDGDIGFLRVVHQSAASKLLPPILAEFLQNHPRIQLEIDEASPGEIIRAIRSGEADVGIITSRTAADVPELDQVRWIENELVALVPYEHPLAERETVSLAELARYPVISLRHADIVLNLFREAARSQGWKLHERVHVVSYESVRQMVAAGLGVAVIPNSATSAHQESEQVLIKPLSDEWARRHLVICSRAADVRTVSATLLIEHLAASTPAFTD